SGDNYQEDTGNGFYGAYQFAASTWSGLGMPGLASQAPYWEQDEAAQRLQAEDGWGPWPACSATLGL
ncbi:MAG TPA: transglycosylase family protein, partial [Acidimicrobiales bacterium]|nr:transglycosylase family protein [Acidimicrobiales bacterium]